MTEKHITEKHHATFESLRHVDENGGEFWRARQMAKVFDYSEYRHFLPVIERAREACRNSGRAPEDHFEDILEMVEIGSGARRELEQANQTHLEVGQKVRQTIRELGGTMPEALPTPEQSIKQIETSRKKLEKKR